jgi:hypothetical protein
MLTANIADFILVNETTLPELYWNTEGREQHCGKFFAKVIKKENVMFCHDYDTTIMIQFSSKKFGHDSQDNSPYFVLPLGKLEKEIWYHKEVTIC